jgi:calcium-independent phospholipase A2
LIPPIGTPERHPEILVWKAARASGAAPSFFRAEGNFVDGGIISNNPSLDLLTEIAEFNVAQRAVGHDMDVVEPSVLLSLGTGVPPVKKVLTTIIQYLQYRQYLQ